MRTQLKVIIILSMVVFVTIMGTLGYQVIEGWNFLDSLYMTIITLTTTGYQEVHQLSDKGRILTMFLLVLGMGIVAYSITSVMSYILNIDFKKRGREKMQKQINSLSGHTIVCGFGRMGHVICEELAKENNEFVIIEQDPAKVEVMKEKGYFYIEGDAAHDENLQKAGIEKAGVLVSMIDNDSDGLYIALAGRSLNKNLFIIVRANDENARRRILRAGANKVILPTIMSGLKVAQSVLNPAVEDFLEISFHGSDDQKIQLVDLSVTQESTLVNKTIEEMGPQIQDLIVVGIRKPDHTFIFNPVSSYVFEKDDTLIAMGSGTAFENAINVYNLCFKTPIITN